ncbi:MAG: GntR family transcriptional regulator [Crocinitomicaceae bacterium]|jgi:predicted RNA-binding protein (virulence factor B family)|nr:GntR family transcriptional regulator [Crocinitomicaceae bacterium]
MLEIGKTNNLRIVKEVDFGLYLDGGESGEILIPTRYVPKNAKVDEYLDVFIYHDSEDRLIATTETPLAQVDQFAYLKVKQLTQVGAFLEWGLMKDLLVPFREQKYEMFNNTSYLVRVYLDKVSKRIAATTKLDRYIDNVPYDYEEGQEVDLIIWEKTDLGYKVIINEEHTGLLYANEIFTPVHVGMKTKGFIKRLREDEKIDVSLQKQGFVHVDETSQMILEKLKTRGGFIEANDNTSPESIKHMFGISKKVFKKAIGSLYKERLITIEDRGIRLVK